MDQKRIHVGLITSFVTMLIYLDQGHLTWTVVGVVGFLTLFTAIKNKHLYVI
ncbi:hypothetical protein LC914_05925 [Enterococcus faecium]|uniref:hypothetical protein n=1 Tax=Enterococcus faecium TaxID=1352 RepID=UPI001C6924DF|nr:hypothetical protein [Enterococcus faecium]MCH3447904.1 hypothetical protein [Enterococcus faecium]MCU7721864.1 hypothetical protein [Enterococcus faecium]